MQRHKHYACCAGFCLSILTVVRGQSSRHHRSQQMSLYTFLPLSLSFVSAERRWSSPAETDRGRIKRENESNVAQPFCHHIDLHSFLRPWRYFCWWCLRSTNSNMAILYHFYPPASHPALWWPFRDLGLHAGSSSSFMKQHRYLGIVM